MNGRLSKIRSLHTYAIIRTVHFDWICNHSLNKIGRCNLKTITVSALLSLTGLYYVQLINDQRMFFIILRHNDN